MAGLVRSWSAAVRLIRLGADIKRELAYVTKITFKVKILKVKILELLSDTLVCERSIKQLSVSIILSFNLSVRKGCRNYGYLKLELIFLLVFGSVNKIYMNHLSLSKAVKKTFVSLEAEASM